MLMRFEYWFTMTSASPAETIYIIAKDAEQAKRIFKRYRQVILGKIYDYDEWPNAGMPLRFPDNHKVGQVYGRGALGECPAMTWEEYYEVLKDKSSRRQMGDY